jgi:hypothetical protein
MKIKTIKVHDYGINQSWSCNKMVGKEFAVIGKEKVPFNKKVCLKSGRFVKLKLIMK